MDQLKLILLILIVVILGSCSIIGSDSNSSQIIGEWEWFRATGTWIGDVTRDSARAPYYQHRFLFDTDATYSRFKADTLQFSDKYSLKEKDNETVLKISYNNDKESRYYDQRVRFQGNDTLILAGKCYDCGTNYYVRGK